MLTIEDLKRAMNRENSKLLQKYLGLLTVIDEFSFAVDVDRRL